MQVMIFAAGKGTRLGALSETVPKCLVDIHGTPLLQRLLTRLISAGAERIVINVFHLAEAVKTFLNTTSFDNVAIHVSHEPELLNTGGGLQFAKPLFSDEKPILVYNADIHCSVDLCSLYRFHQASKSVATLVTRDAQTDRVLVFSPEHHLTGWINKKSGQSDLPLKCQNSRERDFCGIQVVSPVIFPYLGRPEEKLSIITGYLNAVREGHTVGEFSADTEKWFDVGTPETLAQFRSYIENIEAI
ncbi:MAG: NTP transferase domain-containing protein [Bdellovibrionales bacterium]|nr:NTP transferase domain-containing protein [Bdellovibrionales bacterium]